MAFNQFSESYAVLKLLTAFKIDMQLPCVRLILAYLVFHLKQEQDLQENLH